MMDEDAEDNSRSTADTKRCHHRMPSQHGSVEDVKDNNSFNRRYKTLPPYATHHHHGILATIHTILIKQHYHWQERMLLYKHLLSTNKQSPHPLQHHIQLPRTYIRENTSASSNHRFNCTLHYKSMK